jgi:hypothetical protein
MRLLKAGKNSCLRAVVSQELQMLEETRLVMSNHPVNFNIPHSRVPQEEKKKN